MEGQTCDQETLDDEWTCICWTTAILALARHSDAPERPF